MSTYQLRALAVCCWLLALCFAIPAAAAYETYTLFRDGTRVDATITDVRVRGDQLGVRLEYTNGKPEVLDLHVRGASARYPVGGTIPLLLHENNREAILASRLTGELPSPWLLVGVVAAIALGVWMWRRPIQAAARRAQRTDPLDAIVEAAARTRNTSLGIGAFLVVAGTGFALIGLADPEAGTGGVIAMAVLAALTLGIAAWLLRVGYRLRDPRRNEIIELIVARPHELAWFYVHEVRVRSGGISYAAHLWKTDGRLATLTLIKEDLDAVIAELARRAPHARRGYDRDTEALYRERPTRWQPKGP